MRVNKMNLRSVLSICFAVVIFVSSVSISMAQEQNRILDIQEVTSKSGEIKAWLVEDHSVPVIALNFSFQPEGPLYDKDTQGITYILSTMLDEGAGDLESQDFQRMLEDYNISMSFYGGRDSFGGSLYMLEKYQDKAFEALSLALNKPRFDEEPLERMRRSVITSMRRNIGSPSWIAARITNFYAYPDHYYALNSGGTITNLEKFTADDLRSFIKERFNKKDLRVAVAGDITAEELAVKLDEIFGELPQGEENGVIERASFPEEAPIVLYEMELPQSYFSMIWPSISPKDPDYAAFIVMNYIYGGGGFSSRLMEEIREKRGLTYGIYSSDTNFDKADRLVVSASTAPENLDEIRRIVREQAEKMIYEEVSDKEIELAKNYLTGSLVLAFTNTKSIASGAAGLLYNDRPMDYLDGYKDRINAVTKEDIKRVASRIFHDIEPLEVYVGKAPSSLPAEQITVQSEIPDAQ